jgi:hypothetical protein
MFRGLKDTASKLTQCSIHVKKRIVNAVDNVLSQGSACSGINLLSFNSPPDVETVYSSNVAFTGAVFFTHLSPEHTYLRIMRNSSQSVLIHVIFQYLSLFMQHTAVIWTSFASA